MDLTRLEGETLEEVHKRQVADVSATWTGLDHEGRESMCDHMMKVRNPVRLGQLVGKVTSSHLCVDCWPGHNDIALQPG